MSEFEIITALLKREGWDTYTKHPADRGGPTKWGITLASWSEYLGRPATEHDIQAISELDARKFYRLRYVVGPNFHRIEDTSLRELAIDAGVNHGVRHPAKWMQWAAEVKQDGEIGDVSLAAINAAAPLELFLWVCAFRFRLFGRLVSRDPELVRARAAGFRLQAEFAAGWCNRVAEFLEQAARRIEADHNERGKDNGQRTKPVAAVAAGAVVQQ